MDAVVAWATRAWLSVELQRLTRLSLLQWGWQGRLQGFGIGLAGGLIGSGLELQALQFLVAELHTDQLRFGFVRQRVGVVVNVVDLDDRHGGLLK
jgi:hypothetical protein